MDSAYLTLQTAYEEHPPFECYGVFNKEERLMGYCRLGAFGNFAQRIGFQPYRVSYTIT